MNKIYTIIFTIILLHTSIAPAMEETSSALHKQKNIFTTLPQEIWEHILSFLDEDFFVPQESPYECVERMVKDGDTRWPHNIMVKNQFSLVTNPFTEHAPPKSTIYKYVTITEGGTSKKKVLPILETDFLNANIFNFSNNKNFIILSQKYVKEDNKSCLRYLLSNQGAQTQTAGELPIESISYIIHSAISNDGSSYAFLIYLTNTKKPLLFLKSLEKEFNHDLSEHLNAKNNHSKIRMAFTLRNNHLVIYNLETKQYDSIKIDKKNYKSLPDYFYKNLICKNLYNAEFYPDTTNK